MLTELSCTGGPKSKTVNEYDEQGNLTSSVEYLNTIESDIEEFLAEPVFFRDRYTEIEYDDFDGGRYKKHEIRVKNSNPATSDNEFLHKYYEYTRTDNDALVKASFSETASVRL